MMKTQMTPQPPRIAFSGNRPLTHRQSRELDTRVDQAVAAGESQRDAFWRIYDEIRQETPTYDVRDRLQAGFRGMGQFLLSPLELTFLAQEKSDLLGFFAFITTPIIALISSPLTVPSGFVAGALKPSLVE